MVLSEAFADVHGLAPGLAAARADQRQAAHAPRWSALALSAEYVYAMAPGSLMPDEKRFGVLCMGREALAAAYDLDGAFDDLSLSLLRGASPRDVIAELDRLLAPYGGIGAYARKDQISNWFLMSEIDQLANMVTVLPTIFLAVAAFLTSMVLNRLIAIERSEIGLLKAFGYSNAAVGWHYAQLVIAIAGLGVALGSRARRLVRARHDHDVRRALPLPLHHLPAERLGRGTSHRTRARRRTRPARRAGNHRVRRRSRG